MRNLSTEQLNTIVMALESRLDSIRTLGSGSADDIADERLTAKTLADVSAYIERSKAGRQVVLAIYEAVE